MIFYVSCRAFRFRKNVVSPKVFLRDNYVGIDFTFKCLGYNPAIDGRWLYEIDVSEDIESGEGTAEEYKEVILEGLACFGVHKKTLNSAKNLAERLNDGTTWDIVDDQIVLSE